MMQNIINLGRNREIFEYIKKCLSLNSKYIILEEESENLSLVNISDRFLLDLYDTIGDFAEELSGNVQDDNFNSIEQEIFDLLMDTDEVENYDKDLSNWSKMKVLKMKDVFCDVLDDASNLCKNFEIRRKIIEILSEYSDNSELLILFFDSNNRIVYKNLLKLSTIKKDEYTILDEICSSRWYSNPDSMYKIFHYFVSNAINSNLRVILILKTPIQGKIEMRSLTIHDKLIEKITAVELRENYSFDCVAGEPIDLPVRKNSLRFFR